MQGADDSERMYILRLDRQASESPMEMLSRLRFVRTVVHSFLTLLRHEDVLTYAKNCFSNKFANE